MEKKTQIDGNTAKWPQTALVLPSTFSKCLHCVGIHLVENAEYNAVNLMHSNREHNLVQ